MSDLISRQAAVNALERAKQNIRHNIERAIGRAICEILDEVENGIKQLPPAEPKRGKWIDNGEAFICSECRSGYKEQPTLMGKPMFEFCPMCGAKMEVTS